MIDYKTGDILKRLWHEHVKGECVHEWKKDDYKPSHIKLNGYSYWCYKCHSFTYFQKEANADQALSQTIPDYLSDPAEIMSMIKRYKIRVDFLEKSQRWLAEIPEQVSHPGKCFAGWDKALEHAIAKAVLKLKGVEVYDQKM